MKSVYNTLKERKIIYVLHWYLLVFAKKKKNAGEKYAHVYTYTHTEIKEDVREKRGWE